MHEVQTAAEVREDGGGVDQGFASAAEDEGGDAKEEEEQAGATAEELQP